MLYPPVRTVAPAATPVTLAEAKAQCNVNWADDDVLLNRLIAVATEHLDGWDGILGRCLVDQVWRQDFERFCRRLELPFVAKAPIIVTWRDEAGVETIVGGSNYTLLRDAFGSRVQFLSDYGFPSPVAEFLPLSVTFTSGYGGAAEVPAPIKHAMLVAIGHWYENREAVNIGNIVNTLPLSFADLISPYRRYA